MLQLNLPKYDYSLKKEGDKLFIYDILRKKFLFLTPEEWVRQHFINFLVIEKHVPRGLIQVEGGLKYNRLHKRVDILVFSRNGVPILLVECKSSSNQINENVLFQIGTYNSEINALYLTVTNGIVHYYWKKSSKSGYVKIKNLPNFENM